MLTARTNLFRIHFFLVLAALAIFASTKLPANEIYLWVDENGVQHFSQYQPNGDIPDLSTQKLQDATPPPAMASLKTSTISKNMKSAWPSGGKTGIKNLKRRVNAKDSKRNNPKATRNKIVDTPDHTGTDQLMAGLFTGRHINAGLRLRSQLHPPTWYLRAV